MKRSAFERHWWKAVLGLAVLAFLFRNPVARTIVLWILPLGSGIDDLIVIVALIAMLVLAFVRGWIALPRWLRRER
ncbi:MAG: hypothetical protein QME94_15420 [Anaerolineae bacterium]|nr:hypothetical protein [Anaerolineae bacterium]